MDRRVIGDIAEQKFILLCIKNNIEVCNVINSGLQHDLLVRYNNSYKRVQIKSRKLVDGTIKGISKIKQQNNKSKTRIVYSDKNVDLFIVYCPDTDMFYNIPLNVLKNTKQSLCLRVRELKNKQTKNTKYAKDYEFTF